MNAPASPRLTVLSEQTDGCAALRDDDALVRAGWQRRFMTNRHKAEEASALYRSLGLAVTLRAPSPAEFDAGCAACGLQACRDDVVIYTKEKADDD